MPLTRDDFLIVVPPDVHNHIFQRVRSGRLPGLRRLARRLTTRDAPPTPNAVRFALNMVIRGAVKPGTPIRDRHMVFVNSRYRPRFVLSTQPDRLRASRRFSSGLEIEHVLKRVEEVGAVPDSELEFEGLDAAFVAGAS